MYNSLQYNNSDNTLIIAHRSDNTSKLIEQDDDEWTPAVNGQLGGPVQPYEDTSETTAEEEARSGMSLSFGQMLIGLETEGWITSTEANNWLVGTSLPLAVTTFIATLPASEQFTATVRAMRPSIVLRTNTLVIALAASQGRSDAELDTFFTTYAQV